MVGEPADFTPLEFQGTESVARRHFTSLVCNVGLALGAGAVQASDISLRHGGVTLLGELVLAEQEVGPLVVLTHGTLAHKDMELIETLQDALAEEGVSSLAHTLSLGVNERRGMADCTMVHTHRDTDADGEIAAWIDWLRTRGHDELALMGHSRGAKQVARTAAARDDLAAVILLAPSTKASAERQRAAYDVLLGDLEKGGEAERFDLGSTATVAALSEAASVRPDDELLVPNVLYCPDATVTGAAFASYYPPEAAGAETYADAVDAPILVIAGGADKVVPGVPAAFMPMRDEALRFEVIEDADHMFLDFYAEDAAVLIAAFLADLPKPEGIVDFETEHAAAYAVADVDYGEYLAQECASCHRAGGQDVPAINGYEAWQTHLALAQYENGERENDAMRLVARSLDEEQKIAVAAYFATLDAE